MRDMDLAESSPHGRLDASLTYGEDGSTRASFSVTLPPWEHTESDYAAMRKLATVLLWWLAEKAPGELTRD